MRALLTTLYLERNRMSKKQNEKTVKRGVGTVAVEAIRAGQTNEEALKTVQAEFPDAKTSLASINWYRNKLRSDGDKSVKTARELKKKSTKTKEKDPLD